MEKKNSDWSHPFEFLRQKWHEVPAGNNRYNTKELLHMSDIELLTLYQDLRNKSTSGSAFNVRGWYHELYVDSLQGKNVLDFGSGLGIDGLTFAQNGARVTFVDIIETNLKVLKRVVSLLEIKEAEYFYLENLSDIAKLNHNFDVIWCQGSLINAPFEVIRQEIQLLLNHLPVGGRWIELAYPKIRWEKEGQMEFDRWGIKTDGGAPWIEWYDLEKLKLAFEPAQFDVVLYLEFYNGDFNWFDLIRRS
jgi:SAM-dependent methyltransferase